MDGDQRTGNPSDTILAIDPRNNILPVPGTGISPVVFNMIEFLLREAQKATRFHESMTGNQQGTSATATQINSQLTQGSVGIKDKKTDISEVMGQADMYALKLCQEFWDKPFWSSLGEDFSEWIDPDGFNKVPAVVPMSGKSMQEMVASATMANSIDPTNKIKIPYYENAKKENGEPIMTTLDFSTEVVIGESIPKGRTDMYNILLGLAQMTVLGANGQPEPLISADRLRLAMEDILGMKLRTDAEEQQAETPQQMNALGMNQLNPIGNNMNVQTPQTPPTTRNRK
jgi:hypothetical protein